MNVMGGIGFGVHTIKKASRVYQVSKIGRASARVGMPVRPLLVAEIPPRVGKTRTRPVTAYLEMMYSARPH